MNNRQPSPRILLTGATGYVGGRLLPELERRGFPLRCLSRNPAHLPATAPATQRVLGDPVRGEGLANAMRGVHTAIYLVHSMAGSDCFEEADRRGARNFGEAARAAGVRHIVYLGGLADERQPLSAHLRSRMEVGRLLRASGVPLTELRASIVIGAGSLSFEMIRALVDHLPVLVTPRWVSTPSQPIGIDDLVAYLAAAVSQPPYASVVHEIGGSEVTSYGGLMREYARQRGLRRWMIPVPVLTPSLSSRWLGLVTPLQAQVGRKLIDGIRHPSVVRNTSARSAFGVRPVDVRTAIARALAELPTDPAPPAPVPLAWRGLPH